MLAFAGVGAAGYLAALLAQVPAAFVIPRSATVAALGGTIWRGEAALAGGDRLSWRWAPLRSLARLGFAVDFDVAGTDTALAGRAVLGSGRVRLDDVAGTADARLLGAVLPSLPFRCAMPVTLTIERASFGGGARRLVGEGRSAAGACRAGAAATPVAPLAFASRALGGVSEAVLTPLGQRRRTLATLRLAEDGRATIAVTREGATALPFAAPPGGLSIETSL